MAAAELGPSDKVLEIGPGLGPLTELLLEKEGRVLAIEMDARLVEFLHDKFHQPNFELLHADALAVLRREPRDWSDWKLVANLPYSVASPILVELAQSPKRPRRMVATLQLEVARRLMAVADDDDYGVLTLLVQLDYERGASFKIPADCFFPAPKVDSMCVALQRRAKPLLDDAGPRRVRQNREAGLLATPQNDAEIVETRLAAGQTGGGFRHVEHFEAGTRRKIEPRTICGADEGTE